MVTFLMRFYSDPRPALRPGASVFVHTNTLYAFVGTFCVRLSPFLSAGVPGPLQLVGGGAKVVFFPHLSELSAPPVGGVEVRFSFRAAGSLHKLEPLAKNSVGRVFAVHCGRRCPW